MLATHPHPQPTAIISQVVSKLVLKSQHGWMFCTPRSSAIVGLQNVKKNAERRNPKNNTTDTVCLAAIIAAHPWNWVIRRFARTVIHFFGFWGCMRPPPGAWSIVPLFFNYSGQLTLTDLDFAFALLIRTRYCWSSLADYLLSQT